MLSGADKDHIIYLVEAKVIYFYLFPFSPLCIRDIIDISHLPGSGRRILIQTMVEHPLMTLQLIQ